MTQLPKTAPPAAAPGTGPLALAFLPVIFTLLLFVITRDGLTVPVVTLEGVLFFALMYLVLEAMVFRTQSGVYAGFAGVAPAAAFLSLGAVPALLVIVLGSAPVQLSRVLLRQRIGYPHDTIRTALIRWLWSIGVNSSAILVAGGLYVLLGGALPATGIALQSVVLYAIVTVIRTAFSLGPGLMMLPRFTPGGSWRAALGALPRIITYELCAFPAALLVAVAYIDGDTGTLASLTGGLIVAALLLRILERSQRAIERRIDELATLNSIGQALSSSLALPDLLQSIYEQVTRLIQAPTFYIALYDAESRQISFPLYVRRNHPINRESRPLGNGVTEHIIRTGAPLLIRGATIESFDEQLAVLGLERMGSGTLCYLGVPLIADQEVLGVLAVQNDQDPYAFGKAESTVLATIAAQAASALRNASLYSRVYELADKLALLNNVSSVVTASIDLDRVLNTVCTIVIEVGYADKTGIFLIDENGSLLRLAYSLGLSEDYVAQFQEIVRHEHEDDGGAMQILRQNEPVAISNVHTDPRGLGWRSLAEVEGYTGLLAVPLVASEQSIGFLAVFYQQEHQFAKSELDLMSTLANQVAVAVANARLHDDTRARARELSRLVEAARAFTSTLDPHDVAQKVFDELDDLLHPDVLTVRLLDSDGAMVSLAQRGSNAPVRQMPTPSIIEALRTGKSVILPQDQIDFDALQQDNLQSLYVIPLISQDRAFGIVAAGQRRARLLTLRERQLVEAVVNQAATAIRNAQLFRQTDAELADRVAELSAIEAISRKISGSLDLDSIVADVLETALQVTGADLSGFVLSSSDPETLSMVERYGQSTRLPPITQTLRRNEGIIGRVMRTGVNARVGDVHADPDYAPSSLPGVMSELCVPIVHNGERVGALNVESRRPGAFTASHEQFLMNLAEHTAIALGNARLFDERQQQIETLIKLRNLSLELLSATTLRDVLNLVVEYTLIIARARDVHLYLYDPSNDSLTFGASLWLDGRQNIEAARPSRHGRTYQVVRSRRMQLIPVMHAVKSPGQFQDGVGYGAIARIPLKRGDQVLGVLIVTWPSAHYFTDIETRIFDLIAGQAAIAIENARLFDEVRSGRDRMQLILNSARDGIILIDGTGALALANPAAERLLGYSLHEHQGMNIFRLMVRARREMTNTPNVDFWVSQVHNLLDILRANPDQPTYRNFQVVSGGSTRDVQEMSLPVQDESGAHRGRLLVLRDVSQEMALRRFQDDMTDTLVHDLRSPALGIKGNLTFIGDLINLKLYEDIETSISAALSLVDMQLRIVDSLLDIRKLEAGQMMLHPNPVSLHAMIERNFEAREATANGDHIRLVNNVPIDFPPLTIDEYLISRVLANLLDNALHHTPDEGEVRVEATLIPAENGTRSQARIGVIDTGHGVQPELRERIFEKFAQIQGSAVRGRRGTGIGLAFCKLAVEAHGGKIWVESGPEGGAAFIFTLPLKQ